MGRTGSPAQTGHSLSGYPAAAAPSQLLLLLLLGLLLLLLVLSQAQLAW
jgi:hypothetical protein